MMSESQSANLSLIDHTVNLVSAYVSRNSVPMAELAGFVASTYAALVQLSEGPAISVPPKPLVPAVPVKKSIQNDFIACLEDGEKFKSLKRHLGTRYGLTPDAYRAKWNLPSDYPMVAPGYAKTRSDLAKKIGLGKNAATKPTPRGRRKAA